ncbi:E3 ubiquitin-protein ligase TRIM36-like isoform X1 [Crassostrea virginica]
MFLCRYEIMDPVSSCQDVLRCALCDIGIAPLYCNVCLIHLCKNCVEKHLLDTAKVHNVVSFKQHLVNSKYPQCLDHPTKQCELHCGRCDIPICLLCISSGEHEQHKKEDILKTLASKKELLRTDLQELETSIYPNFQEHASGIPVQRAEISKHFKELTTAIAKQGEIIHTEIDTIIKKMQNEIQSINRQHLTTIDKQEEAITGTIEDIQQAILELKRLLDTSEFCLVAEYKSRNVQFRKIPPKFKNTFPKFQPNKINKEKLREQFGTLLFFSTETHQQSFISQIPEIDSPAPYSPFLDAPNLITEITTEYKELYNVACVSDDEIWTCGLDKVLKLYNMQGELLKSFKTKSGGTPGDIAVTKNEDLVYSDYSDSSINLVCKAEVQPLVSLLGRKPSIHIKPLIRLQGWRPHGMCSTSSGDLLVIMNSEDRKQTKVVRFSGSTEKQTIQWDDQGHPLYSSGKILNKYLSENRNLDICVSDCHARAVVVVSAAGKLRFRYTGLPSTTMRLFFPRDITTDSQGRILTADGNNHCIHILDQHGSFLRYIDSCGLHRIYGLCVDSKDNLFVTERDKCKVKKIKYYI